MDVDDKSNRDCCLPFWYKGITYFGGDTQIVSPLDDEWFT